MMGSPFLYSDRKVWSVTFFLGLSAGAPIGECELYLFCHCASNGLTAAVAGVTCCLRRGSKPFLMFKDCDMSSSIRGGCTRNGSYDVSSPDGILMKEIESFSAPEVGFIVVVISPTLWFSY